MENEIYSAPESDLGEEEGALKRPKTVWVIFIFACLGTLGIVNHFAITLGLRPMEGALADYYAGLTLIDHLLVSVGGVFGFVCALQLFRLKKSAVSLYVASLILSSVGGIYQINNPHFALFMEASGINVYLTLLPSLLVQSFFVYYAIRLLKRDVLQP